MKHDYKKSHSTRAGPEAKEGRVPSMSHAMSASRSDSWLSALSVKHTALVKNRGDLGRRQRPAGRLTTYDLRVVNRLKSRERLRQSMNDHGFRQARGAPAFPRWR